MPGYAGRSTKAGVRRHRRPLRARRGAAFASCGLRAGADRFRSRRSVGSICAAPTNAVMIAACTATLQVREAPDARLNLAEHLTFLGKSRKTSSASSRPANSCGAGFLARSRGKAADPDPLHRQTIARSPRSGCPTALSNRRAYRPGADPHARRPYPSRGSRSAGRSGSTTIADSIRDSATLQAACGTPCSLLPSRPPSAGIRRSPVSAPDRQPTMLHIACDASC